MKQKQKIQHTILTFVGLLAVFAFGIFWFRFDNLPENFTGPLHGLDVLLFLAVTYITWLPIFMKILLWAIASHIKRYETPPPVEGLKVAFCTTFVPASESIELLRKTLPTLVGV